MITGSLQYLKGKNRYYYTNFDLYPKSNASPFIENRPSDAFQQRTWLSQIVYDEQSTKYYAQLQKLPILIDTVSMLQGTGFTIEMSVLDPSKLGANGINMLDDVDLEYKWYRNDGILHEFSNANNLKGTKILTITSESCTRDISGTYHMEATNRKTGATTLSDTITIDVININDHPMLYKNLLKNGCGEQDMDNWIKESDVTSKKFGDDRSHGSIELAVYEPRYRKHIRDFAFTLSNNEARLSMWFSRAKEGTYPKQLWFDPTTTTTDSWYNKWMVNTFRPCLVPTDGATTYGSWGSEPFYPSWDYIDTYNKNGNLVRLGDILNSSQTYITRDKIKFATYGGKATTTAEQIINVTGVSDMIDGRTYGISSIHSHFFAYVGIGISTYKLEYVDAGGNLVEDNMIPLTNREYMISQTNYDRPSMIPSHPKTITSTTYNWKADYHMPFDDKTYTFQAQQSFDLSKRSEMMRDQPSLGTKIKADTKIQITPVCYDLVDINLDYLDANDNIIKTETIPGPTVKDIWAVKEKFFIPHHIANLYTWITDATDQPFCFYSQSFTTANALLGVDNKSIPVKDVNAEWIQKYYYPAYDSNRWNFQYKGGPYRNLYTKNKWKEGDPDLGWRWEWQQPLFDELIQRHNLNKNETLNWLEQLTSTKNFSGTIGYPVRYDHSVGSMQTRYDAGAAAFFGVNKDTEVPYGTKFIRVRVIFNHTSDVIHDDNPKIKNWSEQTIYLDVFSKNKGYTEQKMEYGMPRCAVTAMHLSLHPNSVEIFEDVNTYKVNLSGSVWDLELKRLENPTEFWSVTDQSYNVDSLEYRFNQSTVPVQPINDYNGPLNTTTIEQLYNNVEIVTAIQYPDPTIPADTGSAVIESAPSEIFENPINYTGSIITGSALSNAGNIGV